MKILTLVTASSTRPERSELLRMEAADLYPRATLYGDVLNSDILDTRFIQNAGHRSHLYKILPTAASQLLEAFLIKRRYDAIISWAEHLGLSFALLLKLTNSQVPHITIWSWISKRKKAEILRRVHSHIDRIILMSSVQYNFAVNDLGLPCTKFELLKWPVDQKFWRPLRVQTDMICTAGREMRDYGTLIKAMKGLNIRCHIAASAVPGKKDVWMQAVQNAGPNIPNVTVGKKSYGELRELYARSRFVVVPLLPTDTDNGTTTILEAMSMGKAVICSRVKGQSDVVEDGKTGIFVPPLDSEALRDAIKFLWAKPDIAERMGREGRRHIEEYHTLDNWVVSVKSIVEAAIREKQQNTESRHIKRNPLRPHATDTRLSA
jgi:glycosyltransferase involved in cell wall biosynthesis